MHYHLLYFRKASPKCSTQLDFKTIENLISNHDKLKARGFSVICFKNKKRIDLDEEVKTVIENQFSRDKQNKSIPMALMDKIRKISAKMARNQKDPNPAPIDDLVFEPEELSFRHDPTITTSVNPEADEVNKEGQEKFNEVQDTIVAAVEEANKPDEEVVSSDLENITVVEPEVAV